MALMVLRWWGLVELILEESILGGEYTLIRLEDAEK